MNWFTIKFLSIIPTFIWIFYCKYHNLSFSRAQAIFSIGNSQTMNDFDDVVSFSRGFECYMYETANSRLEYFQNIAEKLVEWNIERWEQPQQAEDSMGVLPDVYDASFMDDTS